MSRIPNQPLKLQGRCPSCGAESLFVGNAGYVTCSVIGCKDPGAAHDALVPNRSNELKQPGASEMLEANALVNGDRQASYGPPRESYEAMARIWSGLLWRKLKLDITPEEVALMMVALKLQRETFKPKRDNRVDMHGYLLVLAHVIASAPK